MTESLQKRVRTSTGRAVYPSQCSACHQANRQGQPPEIPALVDSGKRYNQAQLSELLQTGRGRMPGIAILDPRAGSQFQALAHHLLSGNLEEEDNAKVVDDGKLHHSTGYPKFLDPTYEMDGPQYIVIGAGGQRDPATPAGGGIYVAYALPQ